MGEVIRFNVHEITFGHHPQKQKSLANSLIQSHENAKLICADLCKTDMFV